MHASRTSLLATVALAALAAGCAGSASPTQDGAAQALDVRIDPATATVPAGGAVAFAAAVTGTVDTRVTWAVVEAGGGTVDAGGRYTAPATPAVYHVRAVSAVNPAISGVATVTVVAPAPAPAPVAVAVAPRLPTVAAGGTVAFTATVTNATDPSVTWSVGGTACGTITAAGVYTAPPAAATCTVTATSRQDPARGDGTTVTVTAPPPPVSVAVGPSPASVDACQSLQLTATVTNATNRAVTWSVQEGAAGGTVDAAGLYVAPSTPGTYHAVATSVQDPSRSAVVAIAVAERVLSVAVTPANVTVAPGTTVQLTATVTTTCGAFASVSTVTAPAQ